MEEKIKIEDGSNDRKYFTMIPNYVLNHSTATAQALYLQLKRLAGEGGVAYPGRRFLQKQLGISYPTLTKEFKYLLEKKWIDFVGTQLIKTDGGLQNVNGYRIIDLWRINVEHYSDKAGWVKSETSTSSPLLTPKATKLKLKAVVAEVVAIANLTPT